MVAIDSAMSQPSTGTGGSQPRENEKPRKNRSCHENGLKNHGRPVPQLSAGKLDEAHGRDQPYRGDEGEDGPAAADPGGEDDERHHREDAEIHRQDIEVVRHVGQSQELEHARGGIVEERSQIELLPQILRLRQEPVRQRERGDDRHEDREMGPVDLPHALGDPGAAEREAGPLEGAPERDPRGDARTEHEDLRRVREAEARRDPAGPGVVGDVRDQDDEHPDAAEHVEPGIAGRPRRLRCGRHSPLPQVRRRSG